MEDRQILISLNDGRIKDIGEIMGSASCVKILNLLSEEDLVVSDIAKKLKMPINTVDYNVKKLVRAGLIEKASHWWSVKGKKMLTYRVCDRKIVISPKKFVGKVFVLVIGLTGLTALTIRNFVGSSTKTAGENFLLRDAVVENVGGAGVVEGVSFFAKLSPWSWFLIGAWFAVFLFFVITLINDGRIRR